MTLDSITKELVKAWKTSTGWAITLLSAAILGLSIIPGVSLSGLATFGIFLVALQALEFTKEQSREWRRKDALSHCYEAERVYNGLSQKIEIITNTLTKETRDDGLTEMLLNIRQNYDSEWSESLIKLTTSLKIIDAHLKEMGKPSIQNLIHLIFHIDCIILLIHVYSHEKQENLVEMEVALSETIDLIKEINNTEGHPAGTSLSFHIYNLKYMVVRK